MVDQYGGGITSGTSAHLISTYFTDANSGYVVGEDGTILTTHDGGTTWITQTSGTTQWLNSVYFTDPNTGYAVADSGVIIKTTNGGYPFGVTDVSPSLNQFKIYPNPSTGKITLETSAVPPHSQLTISNINGQELITRQITKTTTHLDISNLPNGVYMVQLTTDRTVEMGKFIKN